MGRINGIGSIGLAAAVFAIVALTYSNSLDNGFHFDDEHSLSENPHIRSLENITTFFTDPQTFSRNPGSEMYRPLVVLSYALNFRVGALKPRSYHLVNIAIHLCCVGLVTALLASWGWGLVNAAIVGCLFGVHPLASEPVNYISSRSESMATVFLLAGAILYTRIAQPARGRSFWLSLVLFVCALGSKSSAMALLLILPLVEVARHGRPAGQGIALWSHIWRNQWPYWSIGAVYVWGVRDLIGEALLDTPVRSVSTQLMTQCKGLVYYAKLLLLPYPGTVDHAFGAASSEATLVVVLSALCIASVVYLVGCGIKRRDRSVLFFAWIGAALTPTIIVPLNVLVTERRLYLAVAVLMGFVVWQVREPLSRNTRSLVVLTLCVFVALTFQRNTVWASELTLWEDAVNKAPGSERAHVRLGVAYRKLGQLHAAREEFEKALELQPVNAPALNNLGNVRRQLGDMPGAEAAYAEALSILPSYPEAMINLATLHNVSGKHTEALNLLRRALDVAGPRPELLNNLGTTYLAMGDYDQAVASLQRALVMKPQASRIHFNLGGALEGKGEWQRALTAYENAIRYEATYPKPYYNLGLLHERRGNGEAAASSYRRFLDLWQGDEPTADSARRRLALLEEGVK